MGIQQVKEHFTKFNMQDEIFEHNVSTATVQEAADALGVIPARIAKTLSFKVGETAILVVAAGDAKIDNAKFKAQCGTKAKMLTAEEVETFTGHQIGGVCPFGLAKPIDVFLDVSLKRFTTVFPACGTANSSVELTLEQLEQISGATSWVEVSKGWQEV